MAIDIHGLVANGIDTCFRVLKNLLVAGDFVVPASDYDPTTGDFTDSETVYSVSEILPHDYERSQVDGDIIREFDKGAILRVSDIAVEITNEMKLRFIGGDAWDVLNVRRDPSDTVYFLQLRRP